MDNRILIENVYAREVLNSKGNPAIEVEIKTNKGKNAKAIVASDDTESESIQNAINNVNKVIANELKGINVLEQLTLDNYLNYLDGTSNKSSLGKNSILGVSMAVARVAAKSLNIPLFTYIGGISGTSIPYPMISMISGGKHSDNNIDIQDFMVVPRNIDNFSDRLRMCTEVYYELKSILKEDGIRTNTGDMGSFCPIIRSDMEALDFLMRAINKAGYEENFAVAIDVSANDLYKDGKYVFCKREEEYSSDALIKMYSNLVNRYPIIAIIDGLAKEDLEGWKKFTNELGSKAHLVGGDLFSTNPDKLIKGVKDRVANSILIKPNQIGTVSETIDVIKMAKANGYMPIISCCNGDSEDSFLADFAVALNMKYIRAGAPVRSEHVAKYNQLLRIEEKLVNNIK